MLRREVLARLESDPSHFQHLETITREQLKREHGTTGAKAYQVLEGLVDDGLLVRERTERRNGAVSEVRYRLARAQQQTLF